MALQIHARILNQDSAAPSDQELALQLKSLGAYDINFGHGAVKSILVGYLMYNALMCPTRLFCRECYGYLAIKEVRCS